MLVVRGPERAGGPRPGKSPVDDGEIAFCCRLGILLGKSLGEVAALSSWELTCWREWVSRHGTPGERVEVVTANAGAVTAGSLGWRGRAGDLLPRYRDPRTTAARVKAWLAASEAGAERWFAEQEKGRKPKRGIRRVHPDR